MASVVLWDAVNLNDRRMRAVSRFRDYRPACAVQRGMISGHDRYRDFSTPMSFVFVVVDSQRGLLWRGFRDGYCDNWRGWDSLGY